MVLGIAVEAILLTDLDSSSIQKPIPAPTKPPIDDDTQVNIQHHFPHTDLQQRLAGPKQGQLNFEDTSARVSPPYAFKNAANKASE